MDPDQTQPGLNPYGTAGDPAVSGAATAGTSQQPPPAAAAPAAAAQAPLSDTERINQIVADADKELASARQAVVDITRQISDTQAKITATPGGLNTPAGQQLQQSLNTLYTNLITANQRVAQANETKAQILQEAIKSQTLTPAQVNQANAAAEASTAAAAHSRAETDVLQNGAETQRALTAAQSGLAAAQANAQQANADATRAKTPAEQAQLTAQANQLNAQAAQLNAQIPGLQARADADRASGRLTNAQAAVEEAKAQTAGRSGEAATRLLELQVDEAKSKVAGLPTPEQQAAINKTAVEQAAANLASTQATTQKTQEDIQKSRLGPTYGLQDQIDAIKKIQAQVFGPGGTGDPEHANDLLNQFLTATVGGTTPANAAVNAATAQGNLYATQMTGTNALQAAQASRANQYASLGGQALGTLASMNQYAPKGSTAGADAYRALMNDMATRLAQPQFAPVQMPQAPELPQFMQAFAMGHRAATATAAAATGQGGGGQPAININLNGQGPGPVQMPSGPLPSGANPVQMPTGPPGGITAQLPQGYTNPPSITNPPATGITPQLQMPSVYNQQQQQTPQQAFNQGVASTYQIPNFAQSYLPNPMNMIGLNQGNQAYGQGAY